MHTPLELDAIDNLCYDVSCWIGGRKIKKKTKYTFDPKFSESNKDFRWSDNTPFDFDFWQSGQPDCKHYEDKCCIAMAYHWYANSCDDKHHFICEKDAVF